MAIDLSDDYKTVDLAEAVRLISRATTPQSHDEALEVSHSFWGPLTHRELNATAGCAVRMESAIDIPQKLLKGYTFKPGDQLLNQDDETYNIYSVQRDPGTAFWRFLVYNPKIAYDLRHEMDVYNLEVGKDAAGAGTVDAETLVYSSISCRLQWDTGKPATHIGRTGEMLEGVIYSSQRLYLKNNHLIRITDEQKAWELDVVDWSMTDRLDELMRIRVRATP